MEWTDISITVAKRDADTAEAIATMVANGGIYIEDYSDLEQQAWEIAHVDLIEQELLDKPRDVVIVHMYLAPDENPAEVLPLFEERLKNSGIDYQLNTTGVEQEDWQNGWKKFYHAMDIGERLAIQPGRVEFTVTKGTTSKAEPDVAVTLFAGYPKQGKLEEVIRHSVELGVTEIVPFFSRYCVATPKKEDAKNERYNRIAAEAAKQAGRAMLPHVSMPLLNFAAVCDALQEDYDLALFFYEGGGAPLRTVLRPGCAKKIAIVTGSEGGFSVEEAEAAKAAGAVTVGLGPRILRCETAPLTALTAAMLLTGNLE